MPVDTEELAPILGHAFRDPDLLRRALTHKSRLADAGQTTIADNERLEFLGDAILGFVVSEALVARFPNYPEGGLSKLKAQLVSAQHLYLAARNLGLGRHLVLGRGEELSGGREKKALLANAFEAVIAAIYLDAGMEAARRFVLENIVQGCENLVSTSASCDYKSALQEAAQALKLPSPRYAIVRETGPEHAKIFTVEVRLGKERVSRAEGLSKKDAGQRAAHLMLQQLTESSGAPAEE